VSSSLAVPELRHLDEEECRRLLQTTSFGRIAVTERALPTIVPVLFVVRGDEVIAVSPVGSPALAASDGTIVALEIDSYDPTTAQGWSVTVLGRAALVADPADAEALDSLGISPWAAPHRQYITMTVSMVQGRRLAAAGSLMNAGSTDG
jgi:nitroimidazol reductase NimA-like FMN-containing flavoprotein (pyridoxamine 5'-phosphate oxidase superfamily)